VTYRALVAIKQSAGGAVTAPDDAVMLEKVVPAIVNYAIALFKDTTLVMIVGLFDLLNIVSAGAADPRWLGSSAEGYVFVALVFWIFCFGFSRYSQRVEHRLKQGRTC